jgi:triosephosphate isomerase (TIM)
MIRLLGMSSPHPLVIGNWKLNPTTSAEAKALFISVRKLLKKDETVAVVVAPPFPFIPDLTRLSPAGRLPVAAQDVFYEESGAHTGEVSPSQLASFGVSHVIIGHSERRAKGESDEVVNKKIQAALKRKLTPVVCIGERERDGQAKFYGFVEAQLRALATGLTSRQMAQVVIAYEPIWAIGTGKTATPEDVKEMQLFITTVLTKLYDRPTGKRVRIIYGGSVKPDNAAALHAGGGMNGFLVGGASLKASDFMSIVRSVSK